MRMFSVSPPGPLEEKDATTGAGLSPFISVVVSIVALGFLCGRFFLVRFVYSRKIVK